MASPEGTVSDRRVLAAVSVLEARGQRVDGEARAQIVQCLAFVRVLLQVTRTPRPRNGVVPAMLDEEVARATGFPDGVRAAVFAALFSLEHAPLDDDEQRHTFARRFGDVGVGADNDGDALAFARRPAKERIALATAAVRVLARLGADPVAYMALHDALARLGMDGACSLALLQAYEPRCTSGFAVSFPMAVSRLEDGNAPYTVGSSAAATVCIPDPAIPANFGVLEKSGNQIRFRVLAEGWPIVTSAGSSSNIALDEAREVRVGGWLLNFEDAGVSMRLARPMGGLAVEDLVRTIPRAGTTPLTLLDHITFGAMQGEVIALIGPSGCGKTTLLTALAGVAPATSGRLKFDGNDLAELIEEDRSIVGLVPQDDIVHPELKVEESLTFSARLRLGANADAQRVDEEVERVLGELGITHIRGSLVGDALQRGISGGQRKRVNFAQELLSQTTRLLFLDEPTSGLDPASSQNIMQLARNLADRGRIVFVVTHDLSPQIMTLVNRVALLGPGGKLLLFGSPEQACAAYNVATVDAIFPFLTGGEVKPVDPNDPWRLEADARLALLASLPTRETPAPARMDPVGAWTVGWRQFSTLAERYLRVKSRDRTGLWVLAAQPPFLAAVMALVFPEATMQMMFMLSLSCAWFGMSGAVRELISDRVIWRRERRVGIGVVPYVSSKVAVLATIVAVQCSFLSTLVWVTHELGSHGYDMVTLAGVATLTGLCGMALGLLISAIFSSSEAAVGMLPLILIPQITFSSLLVGLRDMTSMARALTWLDPQRYAFDAILRVGQYLEQATRVPGKWDRVAVTTPLYNLGFKGANTNEMGLTLGPLCGALLAFVVAFGVGTYVRVAQRKD